MSYKSVSSRENKSSKVFQFSRIIKAKISTSWQFIQLGWTIGNFAAVVPDIKTRHKLNDTTLGFFLMTYVVGAVLGAPLTGHCIGKFGSKMSAAIGSILCVVVAPFFAVTQNFWLLEAAALCFGFSLQFLDVSMNSLGVLCQKYANKPALGIFHSLYAIGGLMGSLFAGFLLQMKFSLLRQFFMSSCLTLLPSLISWFWLFSFAEEKEVNAQHACCVHPSSLDCLQDQKPNGEQKKNCTQEIAPSEVIDDKENICRKVWIQKFPSISKSVVVLCTIGGIGFLVEGSICDWSAVYLELDLGANHLVGSFGIVFFQLCVAITRLCSDILVLKIKPWKILIFCGLFASLGILLVAFAPIFSSPLIVAIFGIAITGSGLGMISPIVFSLAGTLDEGTPASRSIATVSSISYIGLLVGPPIIGFLSKFFGQLRWALLVDVIGLFFVSVVALALKTQSIIKNPGNFDLADDEHDVTVSVIHLNLNNENWVRQKADMLGQEQGTLVHRRQSVCQVLSENELQCQAETEFV